MANGCAQDTQFISEISPPHVPHSRLFITPCPVYGAPECPPSSYINFSLINRFSTCSNSNDYLIFHQFINALDALRIGVRPALLSIYLNLAYSLFPAVSFSFRLSPNGCALWTNSVVHFKVLGGNAL